MVYSATWRTDESKNVGDNLRAYRLVALTLGQSPIDWIQYGARVSACRDRKKFFVGQDVPSFIVCEPELFFVRRQVARAFGDEPELEVATNQDRCTRGDPWEPRSKVGKYYVAALDDDPSFLFTAPASIPDRTHG